MELYGFFVRRATSEPEGLHVTLFSLEDGSRTQEFFLAGRRDTAAVASHMQSLTDDQCDSWLNPERVKAKKEAEKDAQKAERASRAAAQALAAEQAKVDRAAAKQKHKDKRNV